MNIEVENNRIFFKDGSNRQEIHPFWLRERVENKEFLDEITQQRLFDPSNLQTDILIEKVKLENDELEINFNDGVKSYLKVSNIINEYSDQKMIMSSIEKIKWDSNLKNLKNFIYKDDISETKEMYDLLVSFYQYGFVIIKNVPTQDNFIINFASGISEFLCFLFHGFFLSFNFFFRIISDILRNFHRTKFWSTHRTKMCYFGRIVG